MTAEALAPLAPGVYAWLDERPGHGHPNAGVVVDADGITIVDALTVPSEAARLRAALEDLGLPVKRLVLTGSGLEQAGGTSQFPFAAVYGSRQTSVHLDQPPQPDVWAALYPEHAGEVDELTTRPVSFLVDADVTLSDSLVVRLTGGQQFENLVAVVPGAQVCFAGAMASFGVTPLCYQGDPGRWADALDALVAAAPIVVPGHGPIGGEEEVRDLQAYLRACVAADGDPAAVGPGPWDHWTERHHDVVNVERAALMREGRDEIPAAMLRAAGVDPPGGS